MKCPHCHAENSDDAGSRASESGADPLVSCSFLARVLAESPREVTMEVGRCPIYEAAQALGIDNATIEAMCRATAMNYMDAMARELNPDLGYELRRFRSSAEDCCEEAVVLH